VICNFDEVHDRRCHANWLYGVQNAEAYKERNCADTTGTVLVPWAGHFQC